MLVNTTAHGLQSLLVLSLAAAAAADASTCERRRQGQAEDARSPVTRDCWRRYRLSAMPGVVAG